MWTIVKTNGVWLPRFIINSASAVDRLFSVLEFFCTFPRTIFSPFSNSLRIRVAPIGFDRVGPALLDCSVRTFPHSRFLVDTLQIGPLPLFWKRWAASPLLSLSLCFFLCLFVYRVSVLLLVLSLSSFLSCISNSFHFPLSPVNSALGTSQSRFTA